MANGTNVTLKSSSNKYVCTENAGGRELVANRDQAAQWETFQLMSASGGPIGDGSQVALRAYGGQYVQAVQDQKKFSKLPTIW